MPLIFDQQCGAAKALLEAMKDDTDQQAGLFVTLSPLVSLVTDQQIARIRTLNALIPADATPADKKIITDMVVGQRPALAQARAQARAQVRG